MPVPRPSSVASSISFRWALLLSVVAVLLAAVGVLGVVSYANARAIVDDLAYQALDQTAARVHDRLGELLDAAAHAGNVQAARLAREHWDPEDVPALIQGFHDAIQMNPALSYISVGLESGAYGHVYRNSAGELDGRGYVHLGDGKSMRYDYRIVEGRLEEKREARKEDTYDPRKRGWYQRAKAKGEQTWPSVYLFINKPNPDYPGLTCATPVFGPDGKLQGVSTADFDLIALGQFLSELAVLEGGVAFVIEESEEGTRRVIAHPVAETFLGRFEVDGVPRDDILPVDQIPDASVRAFMETLPTVRIEAPLEVRELDADGTRFLGAHSRLRTEHDLNWTVAILVAPRRLDGPRRGEQPPESLDWALQPPGCGGGGMAPFAPHRQAPGAFGEGDRGHRALRAPSQRWGKLEILRAQSPVRRDGGDEVGAAFVRALCAGRPRARRARLG